MEQPMHTSGNVTVAFPFWFSRNTALGQKVTHISHPLQSFSLTDTVDNT
jgi:hypothetical protein